MDRQAGQRIELLFATSNTAYFLLQEGVMHSGVRTMRPQAFFRLEALIASFTVVYSAASNWRRILEIRVLRGKMNIKVV